MAHELKETDEYQKKFVANISHDFRSPLTSIKGYLEAILDGTIPPEKQNYYLHIVSSEVQRLSRLVRSMLSIARIEAGELVITPSPVEITDIVTRTVFGVEQAIETKGIEILGLDAEHHLVDADSDLIYQVVYNLVDNAIKFVNPGGIFYFV